MMKKSYVKSILVKAATLPAITAGLLCISTCRPA
jgi:hypothetical protein